MVNNRVFIVDFIMQRTNNSLKVVYTIGVFNGDSLTGKYLA